MLDGDNVFCSLYGLLFVCLFCFSSIQPCTNALSFANTEISASAQMSISGVLGSPFIM